MVGYRLEIKFIIMYILIGFLLDLILLLVLLLIIKGFIPLNCLISHILVSYGIKSAF